MNLEEFLEKRALWKNDQKAQIERLRKICVRCLQPAQTCCCDFIQTFDPKIKFVILQHPIEQRRKIATGRMAHLCLQNSILAVGHDFTHNAVVDQILENPAHHCVVLYPGCQAQDIRQNPHLIPSAKPAPESTQKQQLVIFVIDGTWSTARQTLRLSQNLCHLPRIAFVPSAPSTFRIRKQPAPNCVSTIEAIHECIEILGSHYEFQTSSRRHDCLLDAFDAMVEMRLKLVSHKNRRTRR